MNFRKSVAATMIAGAAVFGIAACTNSEEPSSVTGTTPAVVTGQDSAQAESTLTVADAQTTLRKAVDPDTRSADLDAVVDTSSPATKLALQAFAKGASMAGYTPEVFTVKSVKADGADKAVATVSVKSPHAPQPVDIKLTYVSVKDAWKLSSDAVTQLGSMASGH